MTPDQYLALCGAVLTVSTVAVVALLLPDVWASWRASWTRSDS